MKSVGLVVVLCQLLGLMAARAQIIESPMTVAPGKWSVEADIAAGAWESGRMEGVKFSERELVGATTLISTGVTDQIDVQLEFEGWVELTTKADALTERVSGWGDARLRAKWNFAGDEETGPAWALLPFVKLPIADDQIGNGEVEAGAALLYGQPIDDRNWIQAFVSEDTLQSDFGRQDEQWAAGVVWGHNLTEQSTVYTELLVEWLSSADDELPVIWGVGFTPEVRLGFGLDFEVLVGVTAEAPDWSAAVRFYWEI